VADGYPFWSEDELEALRVEARRLYVERYRGEVRAAFEAVEDECAAEVGELLGLTDALRTLGDDPDLLREHRELLPAARFLTRPVISNDTLKIVGEEEGAVGTILAFLDRARFPWLGEDREPTERERDAAVAMTARLMAEQRAATAQRTLSSQDQERRVRGALGDAGLAYVEPEEIRERLRALDDDPSEGLTRSNYQEALGRGEYTREIAVAGTKCDVPCRLRSGELLPIECKVSNSEVNSVKRLNRETGGKHERWRSAFGSSLHTGAVLAGVFKLRNLQQGQADGILIFFDHDLESLGRFVAAGAPRPEPG
jgi:hypothetical protein